MTLKSKRFYDDGQYDEYVENQISLGKKDKIRNPDEYTNAVNSLVAILNKQDLVWKADNPLKMICLGARNGFEKFVFQKCWDQSNLQCDVFDLDLDPNSGCDFIYDFANMPEDWKDKWDFIYCNAPDHAFDGEKALLEWIRVLKPGGFLIAGWSPINYESHREKNILDGLDCSYYGSFDEMEQWFSSLEGVSVLGKFGNGIGYPDPDIIQNDGCVFNYFVITKEELE